MIPAPGVTEPGAIEMYSQLLWDMSPEMRRKARSLLHMLYIKAAPCHRNK